MYTNIFNKLLYAIILVLASFNTSALVTVGDMFNGCDYSSITDAINEAQLNGGDSEINVTNEFTQGYSGNITQSLTIKGGYDSCADALDGVQGLTKTNWINASPNTSVIKIIDNSAFNVEFLVTIDNFNIYGGNSNTEAGGVNISSNSDGDTVVDVINSDIYNNNGTTGGGILTDGANVFLEIKNTMIHNNTSAANGGGINCINDALINILDHSAINENTAIRGGGIALDSCNLTLGSGDILTAGNMQEGVYENTASLNGGGVYASNSYIWLNGSNTAPASVSNNFTSGQQFAGGGIYASSTEILSRNGRIDLNTSNNLGGGIVLVDDSELNVNRLLATCWGDNSHCSSISGNISLGLDQGITYAGAGHFVDSSAYIGNTVIANNKAENAAVLAIIGNSEVKVSGNLIINNSNEIQQAAHSLFILFTNVIGANLELNFSYNTLADNSTDRVFLVSTTTATPIHLNIGNSIITQPDSFIVDRADASSLISIDCAMLNYNNAEDFSIYNVGIVSQLNPNFVNPSAGNYHLEDNSPAQDFCDNSYLPNLESRDLNGLARGVDRTSIQNFHGTYDLGAFEHPQLDDLIFKSGFE